MPSATPAASIVVPTRNRREILRECLLAARRQTVPVELIVVDDGSDDGTPEMMRGEFPHVRYARFAGEPRGPAFIRNRGSEMASAPIIFPIDDDAVMVSPRTVEQTLAEFDHPRVGAVGIPFINVRKDTRLIHQNAPAGDGEIYVCHAYVGAAHALRREVFLKLGGYREPLFYMGEEGDYCIRMLDAGYVTRVGRADPIHHHESPHRASWRADYYGRRNDVWFAWQNVPTARLPLQMLGTTVKGAWFGFKVGRPWHMLRGLASGWLTCVGGRVARAPVRRETHGLYRRLKRDRLTPLSQVETLR